MKTMKNLDIFWDDPERDDAKQHMDMKTMETSKDSPLFALV